MKFKFIVLLIGSILLASCATIISGKSQDVTITASPQDATVIVDGIEMELPSQQQRVDKSNDAQIWTIPLLRGEHHAIQFKRDGYKTATIRTGNGGNAWVWMDWVAPFALPVALDLISGAAYSVRPDAVTVSLAKGTGAKPEEQYLDSGDSLGPIIFGVQAAILIAFAIGGPIFQMPKTGFGHQ